MSRCGNACRRQSTVDGQELTVGTRTTATVNSRLSTSDDLRLRAHVLGDVLLVRFQGTATDLEQLSVAPQPLDDVLAHVAVAAEDLNGAIGDLLADAGGKQLAPV